MRRRQHDVNNYQPLRPPNSAEKHAATLGLVQPLLPIASPHPWPQLDKKEAQRHQKKCARQWPRFCRHASELAPEECIDVVGLDAVVDVLENGIDDVVVHGCMNIGLVHGCGLVIETRFAYRTTRD